MVSVSDTLTERKKLHGPFAIHAEIENRLRLVLEKHGIALIPVQHVALGMIMHKIARILNKGHDHIDSWHDIAGYATLVERDMEDNG